MKFLLITIFALVFGFIFSPFLDAAPAPTLFAYNDTTKQCGTFRDGDEYVSYNLPASWRTYDYDKSMAKSAQVYCAELGYTNIGSVVNYLKLKPKILRVQEANYPYKAKQLSYPILIVLSFILLGLVIGVLYLFNRKNKNRLK